MRQFVGNIRGEEADVGIGNERGQAGVVAPAVLGDGEALRQCVLGWICLLYTSDAADERSSVDLGGRRIIKKKKD